MAATLFMFDAWRPLTIVLAFILFRFFDILKPTPVREVERLPHGWALWPMIWSRPCMRISPCGSSSGWVGRSPRGSRAYVKPAANRPQRSYAGGQDPLECPLSRRIPCGRAWLERDDSGRQGTGATHPGGAGRRSRRFHRNNGVVPCLTAVLVGHNPASEVYVRNKRNACGRLGIDGRLERLPAEASTDDLLRLVTQLNKADDVHGILVQLPLPTAMDATRVLHAVSPMKDVDCFHPDNVGRARARATSIPSLHAARRSTATA